MSVLFLIIGCGHIYNQRLAAHLYRSLDDKRAICVILMALWIQKMILHFPVVPDYDSFP